MLVDINWISKNYNKYNNLYWNGKLPNINFKISRSKKTWGYASYRYDFNMNTVTPLSITLSNYYDSTEEVKLTTLLHEMIHIADYTFNPHHFVNNHRKVRYDAHGYWFKMECKRLSKFGWDIEKYVTQEEKDNSTLSDRTKFLIKTKIDNSLIIVVKGTTYNWFIKTSRPYVKEIIYRINTIDWTRTIGKFKGIKIYKFNDEVLAAKRSSSKSLRGYKYDKFSLLKRLENIKATEIHDFDNIIQIALAS